MIAAWMLSAMLVGALVTAGAFAADRVLVALRRQTRFVWLAAMSITLAWPAIAYTRARLAEGSTAVAPLRSSVQRMTAIMVRASEQSLHMRADVVLLIAWLTVSAFMLARMFMTLRALRASGRAWRSEQVDGVQIRLSRDIGPAVVGLDPMEVVLPEWALDLEPPLRALVLAHEEEHRAARDPYLLLLSAALVVLVPWNPALWLQSRRLRLAIELDCDARVLRSHPQPERYGLLLLAIAQRRTAGMSLLVPALSEPTSNLERRINAMNNPLKNQSRVRLAVLGGVAVALVVVACAIDAPVAPMPRAEVRASEERPELRTEINQRVDSTIGYAITHTNPEGKGAATAWIRDSSGQRVKVQATIDPEGAARERLGELRYKTLAPTMKEGRPIVEPGRLQLKRLDRAGADGPHPISPNGPVVEQGIVEPSRNTSGISMETIAPTRVADTTAFYEFRVEETAKWIPGTGAPVYPPQLKLAGVDGEVLASFVVDTDGRIDVNTLRMLKATNQFFADAIRIALPAMRFTPATIGGRAVRQVVQQSFVFSVK